MMNNKTKEPDNPLIDVIALSEKQCSHPIRATLAYASVNNFTGHIVKGYDPLAIDLALMTPNAAHALCEVQNELISQYDLRLLIYDAYRPKRAVKDFMHWLKQPVTDTAQGRHELAMKELHYPNIAKEQLFALHYLSEDSQHCYGNTVDLVLTDSQDCELDMGTRFDFMDELSHIDAPLETIGATAVLNRKILSTAMQRFGFAPYAYEFWHYSFLPRECNTSLDIEITPALKAHLI